MKTNSNDKTLTWISAEELADWLGCATQTVRKMAKHGVIPALRVGSTYRFQPEAVEAALAVRK